MGKHDKHNDHNENDDFESNSTLDEVSRIFKDHPGDYISKLEEMGFAYHDDEIDEEEQEEAVAKPENKNQKDLVSFLKGDIPLSDEIVEKFLEERRCPDPNCPLFRKYFRQANKHLLSLISHGLQRDPVLVELLNDLTYFHEYQNILSTVINHYTIACDVQENLETFSELAMDFYYATLADGYDALYALKERYPIGSGKRTIVDFLKEIEDAGVEEDDVEF
ncbi:hypothetical protein [Desulfocastanea catecholica]